MHIRIIAVYAPHAGYSQASLEDFYASLTLVTRNAQAQGRKVMIGGDFKRNSWLDLEVAC